MFHVRYIGRKEVNKYKHICVICRQTGSLATDNVPSRILNTRSQVAGIANRQRVCLPKLGKLFSLAFHHSSGHLSLIYLCCLFKYSTGGLCFKPLEYTSILITIFKENNVCCLCDTIPLHCLEIKFTLNTWRGLDVFQ